MKKVKIQRGILITDENWDFGVKTVGGIYKLNTKSMTDQTYSVNQKLYGIILENKFCICHTLSLKTGESYFGFILNNTFNSPSFRFQTINGFSGIDSNSSDLLKECDTGLEIILKKEAVKDFEDD